MRAKQLEHGINPNTNCRRCSNIFGAKSDDEATFLGAKVQIAAYGQINGNPWSLASDQGILHRLPLPLHYDGLINSGTCQNNSENSDGTGENIFWISMPSPPAWLLGSLFMLTGCSLALFGFMYFISGRFTVAIELFILALVVDHLALSYIIFGNASGFYGPLWGSVSF